MTLFYEYLGLTIIKIYDFDITCYKLKVSNRKLKIYNIDGNPIINFSLKSYISFFVFLFLLFQLYNKLYNAIAKKII